MKRKIDLSTYPATDDLLRLIESNSRATVGTLFFKREPWILNEIVKESDFINKIVLLLFYIYLYRYAFLNFLQCVYACGKKDTGRKKREICKLFKAFTGRNAIIQLTTSNKTGKKRIDYSKIALKLMSSLHVVSESKRIWKIFI